MGAVISAIWHRLRHHLNLSETRTQKPQKKKVEKSYRVRKLSYSYKSDPFDALEWRKPILRDVMAALSDPNTHSLGVYGSYDKIKDTLLQIVNRRIQRDNLFDMVLTVTVTRKPDVNKIQQEIGRQLGLSFNHKSKDKRARELIHRIKNEQKILILLRDLYKGLDQGKVGIPYGADHMGCKILLTSTTEDMLSNHMHTQINFVVV